MKRLVLAALLLAACGDSPTEPREPRPNVTGNWSGILGAGYMNIDIVHDTTRGGLEGVGYFDIGGQRFFLDAEGEYAARVSMTIEASNGASMEFDATHEADSIFGTVNGAGFEDEPLTLR